MKGKENQCTHRLNVADIVTILRISGTILLVALEPLSAGFFLLYFLTGLTDVLDGWIARKTKTTSDFGAKLDSIADLLFYAVMLLRIFTSLWKILPGIIWYAVAVIIIVRVLSYLAAAMKYRHFAALHTYMNKLTGMVVFLVPFFLVTKYATLFCWAVCIVALIASLEELVIHLHSETYNPNTKSIFFSKNGACSLQKYSSEAVQNGRLSKPDPLQEVRE